MKRSVWTAAAGCALAMGLASSVAAADRMYDKDVAELIATTNDGLGKFIKKMSGEARKAKVTREGVEVDVSSFLDDVQAEGEQFEQRFGDGDSTVIDALDFLRKVKNLDGYLAENPGWSGGDQHWEALRPSLVSLADAYRIDWSANSESWKPKRTSDAEIAKVAGELGDQIKTFANAMAKAAKDADIDSKDAATLKGQIKSLIGGAKTLRSTLESRRPASNALESLTASYRNVLDQAASLGLADAAESAGAPLAESLQQLSVALGVKSEPAG